MLVHTVVVAGDGAGADVHIPTDFRVADVGEVRCFGTFVKDRLLGLHEVSDLDVGAQAGARSQMGIGPHRRMRPDDGFLGHRSRLDVHVVADGDVDQMHPGLDHRTGADGGLPFEGHERIDHRIVADGNRRIDDHGLRIPEGHPFLHEAFDHPTLDLALHRCQILT